MRFHSRTCFQLFLNIFQFIFFASICTCRLVLFVASSTLVLARNKYLGEKNPLIYRGSWCGSQRAAADSSICHERDTDTFVASRYTLRLGSKYLFRPSVRPSPVAICPKRSHLSYAWESQSYFIFIFLYLSLSNIYLSRILWSLDTLLPHQIELLKFA